MTYFLVYTADRPNSAPLRQDNRDAHIKWLRSEPEVTLHIAGPWLDEDGEMRGSLLIVEAETKETVEDWLAKDPYRKAGLTASVTVQPYNWVIGGPDQQA
jgi:uncharacterized protein YciI